jgi:DNA-binding response OmpR family regulator
MLSQKRVLVVEAEFLIALDMQRILEEADAGKTVFARSVEEAGSLADRFGEFDLAIVGLQGSSPAAIELARSLLVANVAVVATTAGSESGRQIPGLPVPLVRKPFGEEEFLAACILALATTDLPM